MTAALVIIGLLAVYSSSFAISLEVYGDGNYFFVRQAIWAAAGAVLLLFAMRFDYRFLRPLSPLLMALAIAGLLLVLIPGIGVERNGSSRWLALGPLPPLQPSEFAKLIVIIYISAWVAAKGESIKNFSLGLVPFVIIVGILGWLIMSQPDMGTTVITLLIAGTIFFLSGAPLSHLSLLVVGGGLVMTFLVFVSGYRMDRITSFIAPETDPAGVGFHIIQLLIALGSGGLTGLGWGVSRQKFFYIPGAHTDGIFAIIGEEVGFIGAIIIVALYFVLVYRGIRIAINAPDRFGALLALGITCWIAYQAIINIGGITRTMPLTGVPLPFISYGGSALASLMAGVGILLSVSRYSRELSQAEREAATTRQRWLPQRQEAT